MISSFRDPESGVRTVQSTTVTRYLRGRSLDGYIAADRIGLLRDLVDAGDIPAFRELSRNGSEVLVEQERLPFVSYPYEWSRSMLRAAAQHQLRVLRSSLERGLTLKDGDAANVQWRGTTPLFIDMGSLVPYEDGSVWAGYAQFCRTLLNPFLLSVATGLPAQTWLRVQRDGITPGDTSKLLPLRWKVRPGILRHVVLHASLVDAPIRSASAKGLSRSGLMKLVDELDRLLDQSGAVARSDWSSYEMSNSYTAANREAKHRFVHGVVEACKPHLVWDVGANRGEYSELAMAGGDYVVALEREAELADSMFSRFRGSSRVLPLIMDIANPSPAQGWSGVEQLSLAERGRPDLLLGLAVVHHLRIGAGIPLERFVKWLAETARFAVIEFVPREDPMVRAMLSHRRDVFSDYDRANFERLCAERFHIHRTSELPDSARVLYMLEARHLPTAQSDSTA